MSAIERPIEAGEELTLELMIFKAGNGGESSVLLDNFKWIAIDTQTTTDRPPRNFFLEVGVRGSRSVV